MKGFKNFNRHKDMGRETFDNVFSLLRDVRFDSSMELTNMVYGLFDGYLYDELLPLSKKELSGDLYNVVEKIVKDINTYPSLH